MKDNIYPGAFKIDREARSKALGQKSFLIWFTGLSGSGKSTLANGTEAALYRMGYHTYLLDGDNIRNGLSKDLSFSKQGRSENIRRIAEVSKLMLDAGLIVVCAFISPFINEREMIGNLVGKENFLEIYVDCPLEICEKRDVKGLYQKARKGLISNFTGIDSPYEVPVDPFMVIKSAEENLNASIKRIIKELEKKIKF